MKQISSQIISQEGLDSKEYEDKLKNKFPKIYINLKEFANKCNAYLSFVEECGIKNMINRFIPILHFPVIRLISKISPPG